MMLEDDMEVAVFKAKELVRKRLREDAKKGFSKTSKEKELAFFKKCTDPDTASTATEPAWEFASLLMLAARHPNKLGLKFSRPLRRFAQRSKDVRNRLSHIADDFSLFETVSYLQDLARFCQYANYLDLKITIEEFQHKLTASHYGSMSSKSKNEVIRIKSKGRSGHSRSKAEVIKRPLKEAGDLTFSDEGSVVSFGKTSLISTDRGKLNIETLADQNAADVQDYDGYFEEQVNLTIKDYNLVKGDLVGSFQTFMNSDSDIIAKTKDERLVFEIFANPNYPKIGIVMLSLLINISDYRDNIAIECTEAPFLPSDVALDLICSSAKRSLRIGSEEAREFESDEDIEGKFDLLVKFVSLAIESHKTTPTKKAL